MLKKKKKKNSSGVSATIPKVESCFRTFSPFFFPKKKRNNEILAQKYITS